MCSKTYWHVQRTDLSDDIDDRAFVHDTQNALVIFSGRFNRQFDHFVVMSLCGQIWTCVLHVANYGHLNRFKSNQLNDYSGNKSESHICCSVVT